MYTGPLRATAAWLACLPPPEHEHRYREATRRLLLDDRHCRAEIVHSHSKATGAPALLQNSLSMSIVPAVAGLFWLDSEFLVTKNALALAIVALASQEDVGSTF